MKNAFLPSRVILPLMAWTCLAVLILSHCDASGDQSQAGSHDPTATLSARTILAHIEDRHQQCDNLYYKCEWVTLRSAPGASKKWNAQTLYRDKFGRLRIISRTGTFDVDGSRVPASAEEVDNLYDGEVTVVQTMARAAKDSTQSYRTAQIHTGHFPPPLGIRANRVCDAFPETEIVPALREAIRQTVEPTIHLRPESKNVLITFNRTDDPRGLTFTSTVATDKQWIVESTYGRDSAGRIKLAQTCEFEETGLGIWFPMRGVWRWWENGVEEVGTAPPAHRETSFQVTDCVINDPNFSDDAFRLKLVPGTEVADMRYGVDYRVGSEVAYEADLARIAHEAREHERKSSVVHHGEPAPIAGAAPSDAIGWRKWIVVGNLAFVAIFLAAYFYRKRLRR